ncbi:hypothetical protein MKX01_022323 [Papaver californicum]|nr:hypothetical protein MKX01_022323 [Papaver californicum]
MVVKVATAGGATIVAHLHRNKNHSPSFTSIPSVSLPCPSRTTTRRLNSSSSSSFSTLSQNQTSCGQLLLSTNTNTSSKQERESTPSLQSFAHWISLFFSLVSHRSPVIAVLDGDRANEFRRVLLPSYKAHRRKFSKQLSMTKRYSRIAEPERDSRHAITEVLQKCNVPVLKVEGYEADDVVATLVEKALQKGFWVVIGSPDKDFKQLISEEVQIDMLVPEFGRWSFYTLKHYMAQYDCDPSSDLSLRCIMGLVERQPLSC